MAEEYEHADKQTEGLDGLIVLLLFAYMQNAKTL